LGQNAAIYCRVSTVDQSCERQERDLRAFAERAGYEVIGVFKETGSGAKLDRIERRKVMALAQAHRVDAVLVTELSRWGRSTLDLLETLRELEARRVSLVALSGMTFDLASATGRMMATMLAGISEFERDLLRERVRSGLAVAKARGKLGACRCRPKLSIDRPGTGAQQEHRLRNCEKVSYVGSRDRDSMSRRLRNPPADPHRKARFRDEARGIVAKDRYDRKYGHPVDTAGAIARALERAYKQGFADARGDPAARPPEASDKGPLDWALIPPRPRNAFWSCCLFTFGRRGDQSQRTPGARNYRTRNGRMASCHSWL
jgi:putative DNA-invertase from lambdoid prophage Rac